MTVSDDPEMLERIQRAATHALAEFDRVCHELGLRYVAYGGTAIGAVRHHGFIPWDDDVDVCMPREDYERLIREADTVLGDDFVFLCQENDMAFPRPFGVLGLRGSTFIPGVAKDRAYRMPLGVDVFPLDRVPKNRRAYARQQRASWVWGRLMFLHGTATPETGLTGLVGAASRTVFLATHHGLHALGVTPAQIYRRLKAVATAYNSSDSPVLGDYATQDPLRWSAREDEFFPSLRMPFGPIEVEIPRAYDTVLTRGYGDYMALPPQEERVNHAVAEVNFGVLRDDL